MTTTLEPASVLTCIHCGRVGSKQYTPGPDGARCSNRARCAWRCAEQGKAATPHTVAAPPRPPVVIHLAGAACTTAPGRLSHARPAEVTCHDCLRRYAAYLFLGGKPL